MACASITLLSTRPATATPDFEAYADAIYKIEGGSEARRPYGILSVLCETKDECRRVCINTVRNSHRRWHDAGRPGDFRSFLANRYCPPASDPMGNVNWRRNIKRMVSE